MVGRVSIFFRPGLLGDSTSRGSDLHSAQEGGREGLLPLHAPAWLGVPHRVPHQARAAESTTAESSCEAEAVWLTVFFPKAVQKNIENTSPKRLKQVIV